MLGDSGNTNLKKVVKDDNLIYYDTDTIFVKEINDDIINELNKLDIVYYIDDIRYIYVEGLKRLIWTNPHGGIEVKGMRSSKRASRYKYASKNADLLEEIIRREMRNDTLEKIDKMETNDKNKILINKIKERIRT